MSMAEQDKTNKGRGSQVAVERRNSRRFKMFLTAQCQEAEKGPVFEIKTENISTGGLRFITHTMPYIDQLLTMKIELHSPFPTIKVKGRVAWCQERLSGMNHHYEGGIEFISLSGEDFKLLECFINWYYLITY
jgi:hypothetical protein